MKKNFLIACISFGLAMAANAQVKVGNNPTTLNPSAMLEVEATNKGFLLPRVALQSATDITTIVSPARGLLVYNTNTGGINQNRVEANKFYFWNGTSWAQLINNESNRFIPYIVATARTSNEQTPTGTSYIPSFTIKSPSTISTSGGEFFAPSSGYYQVAVSGQIYAQAWDVRIDIFHGIANIQDQPARGTGRGWNTFSTVGVKYYTEGESFGIFTWSLVGNGTFQSYMRVRNCNVIITKIGE